MAPAAVGQHRCAGRQKHQRVGYARAAEREYQQAEYGRAADEADAGVAARIVQQQSAEREADRQVNAAPKRIASGSKRYSVNPARERMNPSLPPSALETQTGSGSMPTRLIALACSVPGGTSCA